MASAESSILIMRLILGVWVEGVEVEADVRTLVVNDVEEHSERYRLKFNSRSLRRAVEME